MKFKCVKAEFHGRAMTGLLKYPGFSKEYCGNFIHPRRKAGGIYMTSFLQPSAYQIT